MPLHTHTDTMTDAPEIDDEAAADLEKEFGEALMTTRHPSNTISFTYILIDLSTILTFLFFRGLSTSLRSIRFCVTAAARFLQLSGWLPSTGEAHYGDIADVILTWITSRPHLTPPHVVAVFQNEGLNKIDILRNRPLRLNFSATPLGVLGVRNVMLTVSAAVIEEWEDTALSPVSELATTHLALLERLAYFEVWRDRWAEAGFRPIRRCERPQAISELRDATRDRHRELRAQKEHKVLALKTIQQSRHTIMVAEERMATLRPVLDNDHVTLGINACATLSLDLNAVLAWIDCNHWISRVQREE